MDYVYMQMFLANADLRHAAASENKIVTYFSLALGDL